MSQAVKKKTDMDPSNLKSLKGFALIRQLTLRSILEVKDDSELQNYVSRSVQQVASSYNKNVTDFNLRDIKRTFDQIYHLCEKFQINDIDLSTILKIKEVSEQGLAITQIIQVSTAITSVSHGNFGYLAWHITKEISKPVLKRASIVFLATLIADNLYGHDETKIELKPQYLDPVLEILDRSTQNYIAEQLNISNATSLTEIELLNKISKKMSSEGKNQTLTRAWFPQDAISYIDVLIAVCKDQKIDIYGLNTVEQIETAIATHYFQEIWEHLPPNKKSELVTKLKQENPSFKPEYLTSVAGLGIIGIAQLGGISTYIAATTGLYFVSSAIGVTAPFVAYTGLAKAISTAIGPLGVVATSFPAAFELFRAKPNKLVPIALTIAAQRAKIIAEGNDTQTTKKINLKIYIKWTLIGATSLFAAFFLGWYTIG